MFIDPGKDQVAAVVAEPVETAYRPRHDQPAQDMVTGLPVQPARLGYPIKGYPIKRPPTTRGEGVGKWGEESRDAFV